MKPEFLRGHVIKVKQILKKFKFFKKYRNVLFLFQNKTYEF